MGTACMTISAICVMLRLFWLNYRTRPLLSTSNWSTTVTWTLSGGKTLGLKFTLILSNSFRTRQHLLTLWSSHAAALIALLGIQRSGTLYSFRTFEALGSFGNHFWHLRQEGLTVLRRLK